MPPISTIYYVLAVLGGVILVLLIIVLCRVLSMLGKVDTMLKEAQDAIESVQHFVAKPMKIVLQIAEQFGNIMGFFAQRNSKDKKN